jgi:hypothetical protein
MSEYEHIIQTTDSTLKTRRYCSVKVHCARMRRLAIPEESSPSRLEIKFTNVAVCAWPHRACHAYGAQDSMGIFSCVNGKALLNERHYVSEHLCLLPACVDPINRRHELGPCTTGLTAFM